MTWKRLRRWLSGLFQSKLWTGQRSSSASENLRQNVEQARDRADFTRRMGR